MKLIARADKGTFHVRGYEGADGPGHMKHFHALYYWLTETSLPSLPASEQVMVDLSADRDPATHCASGFLHAMSRARPDQAMVEPLRPHMFRMSAGSPEKEKGVFGNYERVKALGSVLQLVVSDSTGYGRGGWLPGDNGNWTQWEDVIERLVKDARAQGCTVQWDIWNEPNIEVFWPSDRDRFFETWRVGVRKLRSLEPHAVVVGPSLAWFDEKYLCDFLLYAKEHDVLPDVLSWHEMHGPERGYRSIPAHVDAMREFMAANGIKIDRFSINEIIGPSLQTKPGTAVWFFERLERAGIESAAHACWDDEAKGCSNCANQSLDGILTPDGKPRSTWWAYKGYADVTGRLVEVRPSASVAGVAGYDEEAREVRMVLGRDGGTGAVEVVVSGLTKSLVEQGRIHVVAERIPYSEWQHLPSPIGVYDRDFIISADKVAIPLPSFGPDDAYSLRLGPARKSR
jgi:hypothetical protein